MKAVTSCILTRADSDCASRSRASTIDGNDRPATHREEFATAHWSDLLGPPLAPIHKRPQKRSPKLCIQSEMDAARVRLISVKLEISSARA